MGKVYDALRRAEAELKGEVGRPARRPEPLAWEEPRPDAPPRRSRLGRWLRRRPRPAAGDAPDVVNKRRIALLQPDSFAAEQFRTLRTQIDSLTAEREVRTIAVTSALAGEGKTTAAVNLAVVTAMGVGRRVLLVDADLRKPKVHGALGLRSEAGLAEVLTDHASLDQAVIKVEGANLEVLPVRTLPPNPSELLASDRMRSLIEELARSYDRVVFDTPATLAVPDAKTISEVTDGVVLVVRADETSRDDVSAALDLLDRRRVIGIVLNGGRVDVKRYSY